MSTFDVFGVGYSRSAVGAAQAVGRYKKAPPERGDETKLPDDLADYQIKPCPKPEQSPSN